MAIAQLKHEATSEVTMKLEHVADTANFHGKTWRDQIALRRLAIKRDRSILWLGMLCGALIMLCFPLFRWAFHRATGSVEHWPLTAWFSAFAVSFGYIFDTIFIAPRIRRALDIEPKPAT